MRPSMQDISPLAQTLTLPQKLSTLLMAGSLKLLRNYKGKTTKSWVGGRMEGKTDGWKMEGWIDSIYLHKYVFISLYLYVYLHASMRHRRSICTAICKRILNIKLES